MSTIRSVKSSSGGAGVLAIEREFSPLGRRYFNLTPAFPIPATTLVRTPVPGLEERLEFVQERIAGVYLSGIQNAVAESVLA